MPYINNKPVFLALTAFALAAPGAASATCWDSASHDYGIPVNVLKAVAKTESGFKAGAINRNKDGSRDIGLMQINDTWLPTLSKFGINEKALLDACTNLKVGAWILSENAKKLGWNWNAIGAYNVGCKKLDAAECERRRNRYAWKIHAALSKVGEIKGAPAGNYRVSYADGATDISSRVIKGESISAQPKKFMLVQLTEKQAPNLVSNSRSNFEPREFPIDGFLNYAEEPSDE